MRSNARALDRSKQHSQARRARVKSAFFSQWPFEMTALAYFDYAATTPIDEAVLDAMLPFMGSSAGGYGNPASRHLYGETAHTAVEQARTQVAALIGASADEIIWTSGATEADNLALKGAANMRRQQGKHIITLQTEHKAVLDTCQYLEKQGFSVTYLAPLPSGKLDLAELRAAIRSDTILVSIMHVNNETGVVQDLAAIAAETSARRILLHVDAAQSAGKIAIDVKNIPIDLLSLSAHKLYGPKGIGALYLRKRPRVRVLPLLHGGGHEQGMRSGTLPTHQIVGMGKAYALAAERQSSLYQRLAKYRDRLLADFQYIPNFHCNVNPQDAVPHILNIRFDGMQADAILQALPIAASTASACQGKGTEGSYVLKAMGLDTAAVQASIRLSMGEYTTAHEIDVLMQTVQQLFKV